MTRWTESELKKLLKLHGEGYGAAEIARFLEDRSEMAVRIKLLDLGFSSRRRTGVDEMAPSFSGGERKAPANDSGDELRTRAEIAIDRDIQRRIEREQLNLEKQQILEDRILELFERRLQQIGSPIIQAPAFVPAPASTTRPQIPVAIVSDWHMGQIVDPHEIDGVGNYNPALAAARLRLYETELIRIAESVKANDLVLLLCGDLLHGQLGHEAEDNLTLPIADQFELALCILGSFLTSLLGKFSRIQVSGVVGNHGRWPKTKKMPSLRRYSNLDSLVYRALTATFRAANEKRICFDSRISSRRIVEVGGRRIQMQHGDEIRGGAFCSTGAGREIFHGSMRANTQGESPPDLLVCGDKHQSISLPYGKTTMIVNGSFVGVDAYSMRFAPSPPSQTILMLDSENAHLSTHVIRLENAHISLASDYPLPSSSTHLLTPYIHNGD